MIRSSFISMAWQSMVSTVDPSRITVILSATYTTSLSLWLIIIIVMPCFLNSSIRSRRALESVSFSEEVGSSRISSFACFASALAISTSCCLPVPISFIRTLDDSDNPTIFRYLSASPYVSFQLMAFFFPRSFPRNIFSPIDI